MKFVAGEDGRMSYLDSVSSTIKPTLSDQDMNSGSQQWEASYLTACATEVLTRNRTVKVVISLCC